MICLWLTKQLKTTTTKVKNMKFDSAKAQGADNVSSRISETGRYICEITRAEKLVSSKGTRGLGLSVKDESGQTADYLDVYYEREDGSELPSMKTVQAILGCLKIREPATGTIKCEKWDKEGKAYVEMAVPGYPDLMGKKLGLLLQIELTTNDLTGKDAARLNIYGVFQVDTNLTVTEILAKKTKAETSAKMLEIMMKTPIRDTRKKAAAGSAQHGEPTERSTQVDPFDDDLNF